MEIDLIILAGGNSTRFGRFKQVEPITSDNESITELLIQNAVKAGVKKIVLVTNRELKNEFNRIIKKYKEKCQITVAIL